MHKTLPLKSFSPALCIHYCIPVDESAIGLVVDIERGQGGMTEDV